MKQNILISFTFFILILGCSNNKETLTNRADIFEKNKATIIEIAKEYGFTKDQFSFDEITAERDKLFTLEEQDSFRLLFSQLKVMSDQQVTFNEKMLEYNKKKNKEYEVLENKLGKVSSERDSLLLYLEHPHLVTILDSTRLKELGIHPKLKK